MVFLDLLKKFSKRILKKQENQNSLRRTLPKFPQRTSSLIHSTSKKLKSSEITIMQSSSKKEESELKDISIDNLKNWIENKKEEIIKQEEKFVAQLKNIVYELKNNLNENIKILERININEKRVEERIKFIVNENLKKYLYYVKKFKKGLENLYEKDDGAEVLIKNINSLLIDFKKESYSSYEKATYLIGELGAITKEIKEFFLELNKLVESNKKIIDSSNSLNSIIKKDREISEIKKSEKEINSSNEKYMAEIENINEKICKVESEINDIKKSEKYKRELKQKQEIEEDNLELEKQLSNLKKLINFKALANIYHKNEKEMTLIRDCQQNFSEEFQKNSENILEMINSLTQLEKKDINRKVEEIKKLKNKLRDKENSELKTLTELVIKNAEKDKLKNEINNIKEDILKNNKRYEKLKLIENGLIESLKQSLNRNI